MRSRLGWKIAAGLVLVTGMLAGRAAFSNKGPAATAVPAAATSAAAPPAAVAPPPGCDNPVVFESAHRVLGQIIDSGHWTAKDHDRIAPFFFGLHTEQKIEILRKFSAAFDAKRVVVDKGARLF